MAFANECIDAAGMPLKVIPTYSVGQSTCGEIAIQLWEGCTHLPVDLTKYGLPSSSSSSSPPSSSSSSSSSSYFIIPSGFKHGVEIVLKALPQNPCVLFSKLAEVRSEEEARQGIVHLVYNANEVWKSGIWSAMAVIWRNNCPVKLVPFYFEIKPNLIDPIFNYALTPAEVRMYLRDRCPADNFLLDEIEFQEDEIMFMIHRAIDEWNELPPPGYESTPITFPYRYHWAVAVMSGLFAMAARHIRRNKLDYQAGGLTINDQARWEQYNVWAKELKEEWRSFIKNKKLELNISDGFQSLSGYRHTIPR
jgi:hypothetical protein